MSISFITKLDGAIETKPGCWNYSLVGVYKVETTEENPDSPKETRVGEYTRNYSNKGPFYPFKQNDKWYALYSKEYMYTRVMSLPDCVDLGGEDKNNVEYKNHFCPAEYFVPELCVMDFKSGEVDPRPLLPNHDCEKWCKDGKYPDSKDSTHTEEEKEEYKKLYEQQHLLYNQWLNRHPFVEKHAEFGFVAGCQWGDDTSWKLEFLDLREASTGNIIRDDRFGYFELPRNVKLKDAIDTEYIEGGEQDFKHMTLYIARPQMIKADGSATCWWVTEMFQKLKEEHQKSPDKLVKLQELEATLNIAFANGLSPMNSDSLISKLITLILK